MDVNDRTQQQIDKIVDQNQTQLLELTHIKGEVGVIKDEVKKTNGRVTKHDAELIATAQALAVLVEDKKHRDERDKDKETRIKNLIWALVTTACIAVLKFAGVVNIDFHP